MKETNLTINTDASFCPYTKAGGWAVWITCDHFRHRASGEFKNAPADPLDAELWAIGNAVSIALKATEGMKVNQIFFNTDCKPAIKAIGKGTRDGRRIMKMVNQLENKTGALSHTFRHVKAHSGVDDSRSYVNEWCDTEAKKWMNVQRKKLQPCSKTQ